MECSPGGEPGNYIMFARATSGDKPNNNKFSACSKASMATVMEAKARHTLGCFIGAPRSSSQLHLFRLLFNPTIDIVFLLLYQRSEFISRSFVPELINCILCIFKRHEYYHTVISCIIFPQIFWE